MRAATIVNGEIRVTAHPDPEPGAGELLVRVRAAGLNGADLLQRRGFYPAPPGAPPDIPGLELAGEVVGVGPGATRFGVGDRVMALTAGGGQAELAVVHERVAMPIPEGIDWPEAGGFVETFTTAHDAVFTQCELRMGERLCVHGGAGGVGTAAIQLGLAAGADVVATVRNDAMRGAVAALAVDDHRPTVVAPDGFEDAGPFHVVLELVGAHNLAANLRSLHVGGRISIIGVGAGSATEIDLLSVMQKRARIHGSTLRARPLEEKALTARAVERSVLPLLASRRVRVPVEDTFALDDVEKAYERFAAGAKFGKIVLLP